MLKQWEKRIIIFQYVYSYLVKEDFNFENIPIEIQKNVDIYNVILFSINNFKLIKSRIIENLNSNWSWERISNVDKSILISAFSEFNVFKIDKKIIIDQWIITSKNYSDINSYKFINYILDRILDA